MKGKILYKALRFWDNFFAADYKFSNNCNHMTHPVVTTFRLRIGRKASGIEVNIAELLEPFAYKGDSDVKDFLWPIIWGRSTVWKKVFLWVLTSLYIIVPLEEASFCVCDRHSSDNTLHERIQQEVGELSDLIRFTLVSCYFRFCDCLYVMTNGVPMGSSLSSCKCFILKNCLWDEISGYLVSLCWQRTGQVQRY